MTQPVWKYVGNLGDPTLLPENGVFLYEDETGCYPPELECLVAASGGAEARAAGFAWVAAGATHRIVCEPYKLVEGDLVPAKYEPSWPHPRASYAPWFKTKIPGLVKFYGYPDFVQDLCSNDARRLGAAYMCLAQYVGWHELSGDAWHSLTAEQIRARYSQGELEAAPILSEA